MLSLAILQNAFDIYFQLLLDINREKKDDVAGHILLLMISGRPTIHIVEIGMQSDQSKALKQYIGMI